MNDDSLDAIPPDSTFHASIDHGTVLPVHGHPVGFGSDDAEPASQDLATNVRIDVDSAHAHLEVNAVRVVCEVGIESDHASPTVEDMILMTRKPWVMIGKLFRTYP